MRSGRPYHGETPEPSRSSHAIRGEFTQRPPYAFHRIRFGQSTVHYDDHTFEVDFNRSSQFEFSVNEDLNAVYEVEIVEWEEIIIRRNGEPWYEGEGHRASIFVSGARRWNRRTRFVPIGFRRLVIDLTEGLAWLDGEEDIVGGDISRFRWELDKNRDRVIFVFATHEDSPELEPNVQYTIQYETLRRRFFEVFSDMDVRILRNGKSVFEETRDSLWLSVGENTIQVKDGWIVYNRLPKGPLEDMKKSWTHRSKLQANEGGEQITYTFATESHGKLMIKRRGERLHHWKGTYPYYSYNVYSPYPRLDLQNEGALRIG